jgi:hypothetical protein
MRRSFREIQRRRLSLIELIVGIGFFIDISESISEYRVDPCGLCWCFRVSDELELILFDFFIGDRQLIVGKFIFSVSTQSGSDLLRSTLEIVSHVLIGSMRLNPYFNKNKNKLPYYRGM